MAYYEMKLFFHGGLCCGLKHIYGFSGRPNENVSRVKAADHFRSNDANGWPVTTEQPFFTEEAPEETGRDRLDRYLDFLKRFRPGGIVEVVLTYYQKDMWHGELTQRNFKIVSECVNSNSKNHLYVYHKVMEWDPDRDGWPEEPEDEEDPFDFDEDCDCPACVAAREGDY